MPECRAKTAHELTSCEWSKPGRLWASVQSLVQDKHTQVRLRGLSNVRMRRCQGLKIMFRCAVTRYGVLTRAVQYPIKNAQVVLLRCMNCSGTDSTTSHGSCAACLAVYMTRQLSELDGDRPDPPLDLFEASTHTRNLMQKFTFYVGALTSHQAYHHYLPIIAQRRLSLPSDLAIIICSTMAMDCAAGPGPRPASWKRLGNSQGGQEASIGVLCS